MNGFTENCHSDIPSQGLAERKQLSSVSTALVLAIGIGIFEALALSLASGPFLRLMGVQSVSLFQIQLIFFYVLRFHEQSMLTNACFLFFFTAQMSEMFIPARQFLVLRALGAPAYVVSLALQGIFRGFKDTKTPVYCLG